MAPTKRRVRKKQQPASKKRRRVAQQSATEQAEVDQIVEERTFSKRGQTQRTTRLEYLCTWVDGAEPQWVSASELEGSTALEDWKWREDAQPELFDPPDEIVRKCDQLAAWLRDARRPVFLLGAGLSAPVLPTFRGTAGLWTKDAHKNTKAHKKASAVQPTLAHRALTALEKHGSNSSSNNNKKKNEPSHPLVYWAATQNYDNLSRRSGFPEAKLSELHGNLFTETCVACATLYQRDFEVPLEGSVNHETGRSCDKCGGALRDSIVHFDETLPWHELKMANAKFVGADLTIVLGSSLRVEPAASLPFKSKRRCRQANTERRAVIVNLQPTRMDDEADLIIRAPCDEVMDRLGRTLIGPSWDGTRAPSASAPVNTDRTAIQKADEFP